MSSSSSNLFYTYKVGRLTVIGFDGRHLSDRRPDECLDTLARLVSESHCQILVVDLMNVELVNSWILGVLAAIRQRGVRIELYHPSESVRQALAVTRLDEMLHVRSEVTDTVTNFDRPTESQ